MITLAEQFALSRGTTTDWTCGGCRVRNKSHMTKCQACELERPDDTEEDNSNNNNNNNNPSARNALPNHSPLPPHHSPSSGAVASGAFYFGTSVDGDSTIAESKETTGFSFGYSEPARKATGDMLASGGSGRHIEFKDDVAGSKTNAPSTANNNNNPSAGNALSNHPPPPHRSPSAGGGFSFGAFAGDSTTAAIGSSQASVDRTACTSETSSPLLASPAKKSSTSASIRNSYPGGGGGGGGNTHLSTYQPDQQLQQYQEQQWSTPSSSIVHRRTHPKEQAASHKGKTPQQIERTRARWRRNSKNTRDKNRAHKTKQARGLLSPVPSSAEKVISLFNQHAATEATKASNEAERLKLLGILLGQNQSPRRAVQEEQSYKSDDDNAFET